MNGQKVRTTCIYLIVFSAEARIAEELSRLAEQERQHKDAITSATQHFSITSMSDVSIYIFIIYIFHFQPKPV